MVALPFRGVAQKLPVSYTIAAKLCATFNAQWGSTEYGRYDTCTKKSVGFGEGNSSYFLGRCIRVFFHAYRHYADQSPQ